MKLAKNEVLFNAIFENSKEAILTLEPPTWKFTSRNPAAIKMFHISHLEDFKKFGPEMLSPKFQPDGQLSSVKAKKMIKIAMEHGSNYFDWTHMRLNKEEFPATVLLTRIDFPEKNFLQATVRDISSEREIENKLKSSEAKFRIIFERANDGILLADIKSKELKFANPKICEMTGYGESELLKLRLEDIHPKGDLPFVMTQFTEQAKGLKFSARNIPVLKKDGTIIYCDINSRSVQINDQKLLLGFFRDNTPQRKTEGLLKESEYFFKESQNAASIGSYKTDFKTGTWKSSKVLDRIFGINKKYKRDIRGWLQLVYPSDRKRMERYLYDEVIGQHKPFNIEYRIIRNNDQKVRYVSGLGKITFDLSGKPVSLIGTIQDITKRVDLVEKLQLAEDRFRTLYENMPAMNFTVDRSGIVVDVNRLSVRQLGYKEKELVGHPVKNLFDKKNIKVLERQMKLCFKSPNKIFEWELQKKHKNGKLIWVHESARVITMNNELFLLISCIDINDLRVAQEEIVQIRDRDESILESIGDAVFVVDVKGKIVLFNRVASELTKISKNQAVGKHYLKVVNFVKEIDGVKCNQFIYDAMINNKISIMSNHVLLERRDGVRIPVANSAAPVKNIRGGLIGCVVVFHDMTKEYKVDKAKTEFVSLASHQLRTPLSTINWYSEILLSGDIGNLNPKQKEYGQEVYRACQRMVALVNALLNVSRLELGTFSVEPKFVKITDILRSCLNDIKPEIVKKRLIIIEKFDENVTMLKVDPKLMGIIFQNLLSNSVKYSKKNGRIEISIKAHDQTMLITIRDNGIGIPKDQQSEIFTKLYRADNAKVVDPDGTGLGLYIVKEIINYTGGKVWFISSQGKGATFYASLPMSGMVKKISKKQLI